MPRLRIIYATLFITTYLFGNFSLGESSHERGEGTRSESDSKLNSKYLSLCGKPSATGKVLPASALDEKTKKVLQIFQKSCVDCHQPGSTSGVRSFSDILDTSELIRSGLLKAGDSNSVLLQKIESDEMPFGGEPLSAEDKKTVKEWILEGAKGFRASDTSIPEVGLISDDDLEACIARDLKDIPKDDQRFTRYLNLATLYNSGQKDKLEETRLAVNKLLNSLSMKKDITNPKGTDGTKTLLRIDIRDYKWTPEKWNEIEKQAQSNYPGRITPKNPEIAENTKTKSPHLRADWLTFAASRPPLYHMLLDLPQKQGNIGADTALEKLLSVNVEENLKNGDVVRAGFDKSNVTKSNRIIERHDTPYGGYWKSHDFKTKDGKQNVLEHPIDFERNGGEFIFNLPNGLQGYLIVDAAGNRLDGAPLDIVVDPNRIQQDGVVLNGLSCFNCHQKGINKKQDEVREHFEEIVSLLSQPKPDQAQEIEDVLRQYKGNPQLAKVSNQNEKTFTDALLKTENSPDQKDTIFATSSHFEAPLDLKTVAAELGHSEKEVSDLINSNIDLKKSVRLGSGKTIERADFNKKFALLKGLLEAEVAGAKNGASADFGGLYFASKDDPDSPFDEHFEFIGVKPGTFLMGSPSTEKDRDSDETQHSVTISKPFEIQTTEVTQSLYEKVTGKTPSRFKGANRPVEQVSWNDAQEFLKKLNDCPEIKRSGFKYRLPTEAEWEYAARGGNFVPEKDMQTAYSFGDDSKQLSDFGWFTDNSAVNGERQTHDVKDASKKANPLKLNGMHGNVWEWVKDAYQDNLANGAVTDPRIDSGSGRVLRGGYWGDVARGLRSAVRDRGSVDFRNGSVGFRLVRTPQ